MHRLNREAVSPPACLRTLQHGIHQWNDVTPEQKKEIHAHLERLQGRLCAYCEGPLDKLGGHIEHFFHRDGHHHLTFEWSNLLWCCDRHDSCGHYKDSEGKPYDTNYLIDPTRDDPDRYFRFNQKGTISIREGLSVQDQVRAKETLRVLGLDAEFGRLRRMRREAVAAYDALEPGILDALMEWPEEVRREFVRQELERTFSQPFFTVIRHLFEGLA